ncbi:Endo-1 [Entamoeba marina]
MSLVFLTAIIVSLGCAQSTIQKHVEMESTILKTTVLYTVYLPNNYSNEKKYPIVYLLHGVGGNDATYVNDVNLQTTADRLIESNLIKEMIIVTPNAWNSWYVDNYNQTVLYETFFINEFIPYVEELYSVNSNKNNRGIGGLSMGGYGALYYGLNYQQLFSSCAPMSAAVHKEDLLDDPDTNTMSFAELTIYEVYNTSTYYRERNIDTIVRTNASNTFNIPIRFAIGLEDYLVYEVNRLHEIMDTKKLRHEFHIKHGYHSYDFWKEDLQYTLEFISEHLN